MPKIEFPFGDVPDIIEPGEYEVKVMTFDIRDTKDGEGQYINWRLEVSEPGSDFQGESLFYMTPIKVGPGKSPRALRMLPDFLEACGFAFGAEDTEFDPNEVVGAEVLATVKHEEWEGQPQARVRRIRPL